MHFQLDIYLHHKCTLLQLLFWLWLIDESSDASLFLLKCIACLFTPAMQLIRLN